MICFYHKLLLPPCQIKKLLKLLKFLLTASQKCYTFDKMEITFIGTGSGVPSKRRGPSSILIKIKKDILLIDTGPGTLRKLLDVGLTYKDIDYLLYTHFHLDHIADFAPILFASKYELDLRKKDLTVIGPKGMQEFYQQTVDLYGVQIQNLPCKLHIIEVTDNFSTPNWEINVTKTKHTHESMGYRLKDNQGKILVYPGDTEPFPSLAKFAEGADLLVLECAFPEPTPGHLYPEVVGEVAQTSGAKQLIITHLYPVCDKSDILSPIRAKFDGKITIAEDFMQLEI